MWITNVIAFALWYWDLDAGRRRRSRRPPAQDERETFAFPESTCPSMPDGRWYPKFVDYLAVSFNTATAFSPTDVSAVKPRAKLLMIGRVLDLADGGHPRPPRAINIL